MKNLLLFGALFGSGQIISAGPLVACLVAFIAFCSAASSVYLLNDVLDRQSDANHPVKRLRTVAAGRLSPRIALVMAGLLGGGAVVVATTQNRGFVATVAVYLALQVSYCIWLRSQAILDIVAVAGGFLLRAIGGGVVTGIHLTPWFLAVVGFGALFVVAGKRASEVARTQGSDQARSVAQRYTPAFLRTVGMIALNVTIVTYCLWAFTRYESGTWLLAATVVPFVIATLRYAQLVDAGLTEAPEMALFSDRLIQLAGVAWALLFTANALQDSGKMMTVSILRHLALLAVVLLLAYTGWVVSWKLGLRRISELVSGTIIVGTAEVVALSLTMGQIPGAYRPLPLGIGVLLLAIGAHVVAGRQAGRAFRRLAFATMGHLFRYPRKHFLLVLFALLLGIAYAARVLVMLRLPIIDYDGLWYHLIGPDQWIIDGQITRPTHVIWSEVYPANMELVMAWPGVFLRTMWFATPALLPMTVLAVVSVTVIARRLGAHRPAALLGGLVFAATPSVVSFIGTSYVDISLAAFVLGAAALLLGVGRRAPHVGRLIIAGASLGLATGTKTSGLVSFAVLGVSLAVRLLWLRRQGLVQRLLGLLIAFSVPVAALGTFWYLRTWFIYGNPLYPVSMFGFAGKGTVDELFMNRNTPEEIKHLSAFGALWHSWLQDFEPRHVVYWARLGGFGSSWLPVVLPAALVGAVLTLRRRTSAGLTLLAVAVAVMVSSPAAWWPRYVLITVGIAAALAAVAIGRLPRWPVRLVTMVLACAAMFSNFGVVQDPITKLALSRDPDPTTIFGWDRFADYERLPDGTTIGWVPTNKEALLHPMSGMDLRRRVVALRPTHDLQALSDELIRTGAGYVVLDEADPLYALMVATPERFRRIPSRADADFDWPLVFKHRMFQVVG